MDEEAYRERGIELLAVDRGGLATWHGPGQWVAFAVDRLDRLTGDSRGVRRAVEGLLDAAAGVARRYAPGVELRWGAETGLWLPGRGKLASVGVHVERGVLLHGLSLNVQRSPGSFLGLRACGLDAQPAFLAGDAGVGCSDGGGDGGGTTFEKVGAELQEALLARFWRASVIGRPRNGE
jgi:lipoate-protein ligase B